MSKTVWFLACSMVVMFVAACGRSALPVGDPAPTYNETKDAGGGTSPIEDAGTQDSSMPVGPDAGPQCDQPGQPRCSCLSGFERDGLGNCVDIDECLKATDGCAQVCTNEIGSYSCGCNDDDAFDLVDGNACEPAFSRPQVIREPTTDQITDLDIAGNHDGMVLVTWIEAQTVGFGGTLHMRSFDSTHGWDLTDYSLPVSQDTFRPRVAVDEFGNGIVLWQSWQTDHWVTSTSRFTPGVGFSEVASVSADEAASNAWGDVVMQNDGDAIVVWAREDAAGTVIRTGEQLNGSSIWDQRKTLVDLGNTAVYDMNVVGNTAGQLLAAWTESEKSSLTYHVRIATRDPVFGWNIAELLTADFQDQRNGTTVALNNSGQGLVGAFIRGNDETDQIVQALTVGSTPPDYAEHVVTVPESATSPEIAIDGDGYGVCAALVQTGDNKWLSATRRFDPSTGWSTPETLGGEPQVYPELASVVMNGAGQLLASWNEEIDPGSASGKQTLVVGHADHGQSASVVRRFDVLGKFGRGRLVIDSIGRGMLVLIDNQDPDHQVLAIRVK